MSSDRAAPFLVYAPEYNTDLRAFGVDKPFALDRGQRVLAALSRDLATVCGFTRPEPVSMEDVALVHTPGYLASLNDPDVWQEIFEFKGAEYNPLLATRPLNELIDDIRLKCGGTVLAAEIALRRGLSVNLGGGYHHAFPDRGRGFCVLHDIAIAARSLQRRGLVRKIMIVDLDFHQGDGTAVVFRGDADVFTLSVHSQEGWPEEKQESSLDVGILAHEEHRYLEKVRWALDEALTMFTPELVFYVAGSDPYELDVLPGTRFLRLPLADMRARDELVIDTFSERGTPLAMVFAGGYGPDVWEVHYWAVRRLLERAGILDPAAAQPDCNRTVKSGGDSAPGERG